MSALNQPLEGLIERVGNSGWDKSKAHFWQGFWWWFDPSQGDWFIGNAPHLGRPKFATLRAIQSTKTGDAA